MTPDAAPESVPEKTVIAAWLRHEFGARDLEGKIRLNQREAIRAAVEDPDLEDEDRNRLRREVLWAFRGPLLDRLPEDRIWFRVRIPFGDLDHLRPIRSPDWDAFTGGTGRFDAAAERAAGPAPGGERSGRMAAWIAARARDPGDGSVPPVVLFARDSAGPYTVLDGNHRVTALLVRRERHPDLPLPGSIDGYVAVSAGDCVWHREET